jgi:murein lipoprotein
MKGPILYRSRILAVVAATGIVAGLGGCASSSDVKTLRDDVTAARAEASAAKAEAAAASQAAARAEAMASDAMNTANAAKASSEETETKIDRMFKKAMYK